MNPIPATRRALVAAALLALPQVLAAQDDGFSFDFGAPPERAAASSAIPDTVLAMALARFNDPATVRSYGGAQVNATIEGSIGVYAGDARIAARVDGDVVVINGSLRLDSTAVVTGQIIVLGGHFFADPGARYPEPVVAYTERASVRRAGDATLVETAPMPTLRDLAGRVTTRVGDVVISPRFHLGAYNRVEGLPISIGPALAWAASPQLDVELDAGITLRTSREPSGTRGGAGWFAGISATRHGPQPLTVGIDVGDQVVATADQPLHESESSIGALFFRRDYRDWYRSKSSRLFARWQTTPNLGVDGSLGISRERSLPAVDAFSILRGNEPWRANPLVDDGRFTTLTLGATWDTRDERATTQEGWFVRVEGRSTTSGDLAPYLLPEQIREPLPTDGYQSFETRFDIRRYQRIDPMHAVHVRLVGEGWLGGDPLTIQRRLALGGADFVMGYPFRSVTCDSRRRPDPATPALCDRRMFAQVELRRRFDVSLATRVGPYVVGFDRADLVVFSDFGSAWLAGDGPGQVPADRIQSISEWRGSIGLGIDAGTFGAYLAKSVTSSESPKLAFRLQRRF